MLQAVHDYFVDLESLNVKKRHKAIDITNIPLTTAITADKHIQICTIDDILCYAKTTKYPFRAYELTSSKMMHDIGIPTPIVAPTSKKDGYLYYSLSQNVYGASALGLFVVLARDCKPIRNLQNEHIENHDYVRYKFLYDEKERENLLSFMTEECLEDLTFLLMLDDIRGDGDRHLGNWFLYKPIGAEKYTGIIPIDNEYCAALLQAAPKGQEFIDMPYASFAYYGKGDEFISYYQRMTRLNKLIQDGKISGKNIERLKCAISYDMPNAVKAIGQKYSKRLGIKEETKLIYDPISTLWDNCHQIIGKEIGL